VGALVRNYAEDNAVNGWLFEVSDPANNRGDCDGVFGTFDRGRVTPI
jgi:hypothetical protein